MESGSFRREDDDKRNVLSFRPLTTRQQPHYLRRELVRHLLHVRHWPRRQGAGQHDDAGAGHS